MKEFGAGRVLRGQITRVGRRTPAEVGQYIQAFARHADADELIAVHQAPATEARRRSLDLLAECVPHVSAA